MLRSGDIKVRLLLTPNSKKRFIKRVREYNGNLNAGLWDEKEYMKHLLPATSFALKADALGLVLKPINTLEIKLPAGNETMTGTMLMTTEHQPATSLYDRPV